MEVKLLELHFSQLQTEWVKSKHNIYSDLRKQEYHINLGLIIKGLGEEDFSTFDDSALRERYYIISMVFKSLEFLNNSTSSTIPYEMVFTLETALQDWWPAKDFIIVTSLINSMNRFSFDGSLIFNSDLVYKSIEILYDVTFKQKLIQINLPGSLSRDYLANVVLYHELGHFVERIFAINQVVHTELLAALKRKSTTNEQKNNIYRYFPYLKDRRMFIEFGKVYNRLSPLAMHISEYFCDIFASQYIRDSMSDYLEYISTDYTGISGSHPSTKNRVDFVNGYLACRDEFVLNEYKRVIKTITGIDVGYKAIDLSTSNFESLIPVEIIDRRQLHNLFTYGWKVWMGNWENISQKADIRFKLSSGNVYSIINNLIEKSIGNFIIRQEWEAVKTTKP